MTTHRAMSHGGSHRWHRAVDFRAALEEVLAAATRWRAERSTWTRADAEIEQAVWVDLADLVDSCKRLTSVGETTPPELGTLAYRLVADLDRATIPSEAGAELCASIDRLRYTISAIRP